MLLSINHNNYISSNRYPSCQAESSHQARPSAGCGYYCSGPPSPCPYEGTHLRKRPPFSEHGANILFHHLLGQENDALVEGSQTLMRYFPTFIRGLSVTMAG